MTVFRIAMIAAAVALGSIATAAYAATSADSNGNRANNPTNKDDTIGRSHPEPSNHIIDEEQTIDGGHRSDSAKHLNGTRNHNTGNVSGTGSPHGSGHSDTDASGSPVGSGTSGSGM